jgi:hypothetical protein
MTTAASTKIPIAIANPPRDMRFAETPKIYIKINVKSTDNGKIRATVNALRKYSTVTSTTKPARQPQAMLFYIMHRF